MNTKPASNDAGGSTAISFRRTSFSLTMISSIAIVLRLPSLPRPLPRPFEAVPLPRVAPRVASGGLVAARLRFDRPPFKLVRNSSCVIGFENMG